MQLLLIKTNATHANPEYALLGKKQAEDRFTPSDWTKVRSLAKGRKVVLLLPNSEVVLTTVNIPSKNKKQLHQAIPYALEDTLADDIENLHFAIHQQTTLGDSHVAIINRDRLDFFIDLLREKSIPVHFVLPQLLAQPFQNKGWSILQQATDLNGNQPVTVRLGDFNGFTCDKNLLSLFLTEQLEKISPEVISSNIESNELPEDLQSLTIVKADPAIVQYQSIENALPLNLLTGFVSHKKESNFNWKAWRPPIILASLVAATGLGVVGWQNNQLQQEQDQLKQSIEKIFASTFPSSRVVDAPQQMSSKLAQLKKTSVEIIDSPLPLISNIAPLLKSYKDLTLKEIRYQENSLTMVMQSPNLTRIEAFKKEAATKSKLKVSVKSSTTTANKVETILTIAPLDAASIKENTTEVPS
ncbi:MAG: type II secretion system protein GspL [Cocleimonas sp.]|nr:type II secretion system protein GspL [Cocleimonas sp.]